MTTAHRVSAMLCIGWLLTLMAGVARALDLVADGKPCATIVVADDAGKYQRWAAQWLQEYVRKATKAELLIVPENEKPTGTLVSVGHTKMAGEAGIKTDDLQHDGCRLVVKDGHLYLIGRDDIPRFDRYPAPQASFGLGSAPAVIGKWIELEVRGVVPAETERMDLSVQHVAVDRRRKDLNITSVHVDDVSLLPAPGRAVRSAPEPRKRSRERRHQ